MLASAYFVSAPRLAPFLNLVVRTTIDGNDIDEDTIGYTLFPETFRPDESSDVRVNGRNLRKRLDEYYADDGIDDPVIIALPQPPAKRIKLAPGEAYKPTFGYNPRHPIDQDYRRAVYHLSQCNPGDDGIALDYFASVLTREPLHASAHAGKADVDVRRAMYYHEYVTPEASLKQAQVSAEEALRCNPKLWRAHAVQGILHCFHRRWDAAQAAFDNALTCDANLTRYGAWYYPAFLVAIGQTDKAVALTKERAREKSEDLPSQMIYGVFLYLARRFDQAVFALALAEAMNARQWLTRTASALLALAENEPAAAHIILVHQLVGDDILSGLLSLCLAESLRLRKSPEQWGKSRTNATDPLFAAVYAALDELIDTLPAPSQQLTQLNERSKRKYVAPIQLALACMAVNDGRNAVKHLADACREFYPLVAWMHILPVFDGLRGRKDFQKLVERAGFLVVAPDADAV
jgi:tetratricopeptide (TPR) repeat protein